MPGYGKMPSMRGSSPHDRRTILLMAKGDELPKITYPLYPMEKL
jgi:hypothetical protein